MNWAEYSTLRDQLIKATHEPVVKHPSLWPHQESNRDCPTCTVRGSVRVVRNSDHQNVLLWCTQCPGLWFTEHTPLD